MSNNLAEYRDIVISAALLVFVFVCSVAGLYYFRNYAQRNNIVAVPNYRTLHESEIPRGGGLIFSAFSIIGIIAAGFYGLIPVNLILVITTGGIVSMIFGFYDDVTSVPPKAKLIIQILLSIFIILCADENGISFWYAKPLILVLFNFIISVTAIVWLLNLYNFMDGIDGMAAAGAVFICLVLALILIMISAEYGLILIPLMLGISCLAFLLFNWPPASIFMGDSGSMFLGYAIGILMIKTISSGYLSIWTWFIIMAYFVTDTTVTLLLRIILVKKWYGAHRSHAYQNLARIWNSHIKVIYIVFAYHVLWLLPLAIWSVFDAIHVMYTCVLAILPVVIWSLRYGPILSRD